MSSKPLTFDLDSKGEVPTRQFTSLVVGMAIHENAVGVEFFLDQETESPESVRRKEIADMSETLLAAGCKNATEDEVRSFLEPAAGHADKRFRILFRCKDENRELASPPSLLFDPIVRVLLSIVELPY